MNPKGALIGEYPHLINDLKTFGLFFEDFVIRDLKIYSELLFENKMKRLSDFPPFAFKMIITATEPYQKINENTYIVPINMLKA